MPPIPAPSRPRGISTLRTEQSDRLQRPNSRNLTCSLEAVRHETAVRVRAIPVRRAVTWRAIFGQLDTMDKLDLFHLAGRYPKVSGFRFDLRHVHALF